MFVEKSTQKLKRVMGLDLIPREMESGFPRKEKGDGTWKGKERKGKENGVEEMERGQVDVAMKDSEWTPN